MEALECASARPTQGSPDPVPAYSGLYGLEEGLPKGPDCHTSLQPVCFAFGTGTEGEQAGVFRRTDTPAALGQDLGKVPRLTGKGQGELRRDS